MTEDEIAAAAAALAEAERSGVLLDGLAVVPGSVGEAHAVQDRVAGLLGAAVGGFKATAPTGGEPTRGLIYARMIRPSPARIPAPEVPHCGVEAEVAFRFTRALPGRAGAYGREEVAAAVVALPAIEVVSGRYREASGQPALEQLADRVANGALVAGAEVADWATLDLGRLRVRMVVNGETVVEKQGGHPIGDPLAVAMALVNMMRGAGGVAAGQLVTTGSWTGLRFLKPGDRCAVAFEGLGGAEVVFAA